MFNIHVVGFEFAPCCKPLYGFELPLHMIESCGTLNGTGTKPRGAF